jgi:hypothetical protein
LNLPNGSSITVLDSSFIYFRGALKSLHGRKPETPTNAMSKKKQSIRVSTLPLQKMR